MKQSRISLLVDITRMLIIIVTACVLVSIIVLLVSDVPQDAISSFFLGPFTSLRRIGNIIEAATPLMFTALAVIIIFRAGQFSMISEGAFFVGATGAMIAGISFNLPPIIHPIVTILSGALFGALASSIPAVLKRMWNVSELVTSLMLNYVCLNIALYIMNYHYRDNATTAFQSHMVRDTAKFYVLIEGTRIHAGIPIALVLCGVVGLMLFRSRSGFKLRVTGDNPMFAHYAGINAVAVMFFSQIIAGAIAGAGGAIELLGMYSRFKWTSLPGYGWTGIVVALLARRNPIFVPISALFIAYLNVGADIMSRSSDVSSEMVLIIQGVIMILVAAEALLGRWRQRMIVRAAEKDAKQLASSVQADIKH